MVLLFALALHVGELLVATEKSHDSDLAKSVVLIVHSDSDGVMGLILNHPLGKSQFFGGPIPLGTRTLSRTKPANATQIIPGVYMSPNSKDAAARTYTGYVGWSQQQLTDEISLGLWKQVTGAASIVFDAHPETLWQRER